MNSWTNKLLDVCLAIGVLAVSALAASLTWAVFTGRVH